LLICKISVVVGTLIGAGPSPAKADTQSGAAAVGLTQQQQQQQIKSRRREFKAAYLTAAIVGSFVVLFSPHMVGRSAAHRIKHTDVV